MLDKRTTRLLNVILQICGEDGAYKIIEISDLGKAMLPRHNNDEEVIMQMVKFLAAADMIDVKYSDESVICIAILPKGRIYEEEHAKVVNHKSLTRGMAALIIFGSFLAAIIGAVVASVILSIF